MPLYNEAESISRTLEGLNVALTGSAYDPVFVIQNDKSTDSSLQVIETLNLYAQGKIWVESNLENLGHGPSVMRAYHRALETGCDLILHLDSDGDIDFRTVVSCVDSVRLKLQEVVIGSRVGRTDPAYRKLVSQALRFGLLILFGVRSPDVNSPIRAYHRQVLEQALRACPMDSLIPHVLLTIVSHSSIDKLCYQSVTVVALTSDSSLGSTWRASRRIFGLPTRFIKLVAKAVIELLRFRVRLRQLVRN